MRSETHRRTYQPSEPFTPGSGVSEGSFPLGPLESPKEPVKDDPEPDHDLTPGLSGVRASQKPEVPGGENLSQPPSPKAI